MRLALFDIDGTLMLSGGAGQRALIRALGEVFGLEDPLKGVRLHGQTDRVIVRDALSKAGRGGAAESEYREVERRYLRYLAEEMPQSQEARLMPGVRPLLEALSAHADVVLGLVTGNLEAGARIKLGRFELNAFFPLGGYGSDSSVRRDLVPIAMDRARKLHGCAFEALDVVVIGDTEKDVDCGRHNGVRTVAVATGGLSHEELGKASPDHLFHDFLVTSDVVAAILGA